MKYLFFSLLLILSFLKVKAQTGENSPLEKELNHIEYLVDNGRENTAFDELNVFIRKHPSNARAYYLRAKNYFNSKSTKAALQDISLALKYKNNVADYHFLKGEILFELSKYKSSAESFDKAFKLCDTLYESCYRASEAFLRAENFSLGEKTSKKYLEKFPDSDSAKLLLAEAYLSQEEEIEALKIVNSVNKKDALFYRMRGIVYNKTQMYELSLTDFNTALDLNPKLTDVYLWRGLSYYFSGEKQKAKSDWNTALEKRLYKANQYLEKYR